MNNIYFIKAHPHWPVGNAGAVVIASTSESAVKLAEKCGLLKPEKPVPIGRSHLKEEQVIFYNNGDY